MAFCTVPSDRTRFTNSSTTASAAALLLRTPIAISTTLKRPGSTRAPGTASAMRWARCRFSAVHIGLRRCKRVACRLKATGHRDNLCILDEAPQNRMRRAPLCDPDSYTGTVDLFGAGRCRAGAGAIAVIHLHECRAEDKIVSATGISCSEPDIPVIGSEAFVVACRIVVGLEFDRDAEMCS